MIDPTVKFLLRKYYIAVKISATLLDDQVPQTGTSVILQEGHQANIKKKRSLEKICYGHEDQHQMILHYKKCMNKVLKGHGHKPYFSIFIVCSALEMRF